MHPEFAFRRRQIYPESESKPYEVSIYGDGNREYEGYFMVVLDGFDEYNNTTGERKGLYVKAESRSDVEEFINHIINTGDAKAFKNNEKLHIRKTWEVVTK